MTSPSDRPAAEPAASRAIDIDALADGILRGERRALARAITLVESRRADHQEAAEALLAKILPQTGKSVRLGISGTPGVGKSTFIEAFGSYLTGEGHKVAVLAVDPSSKRTGGSILGDKTRMAKLARDNNAFIRPSPSGGTLGGVARRTREAMLLVEAAGFDVVLVETVGVGQSETTVAEMVDMFLLLLAPAGGDELQGIKRGVMELADLVVINKADGDLLKPARHAAADYRAALHLMRPKSAAWTPRVELASALTGTGIDTVWKRVQAYMAAREEAGEIAAQRAEQAHAWMWSELSESLLARLKGHEAVSARLEEVEGKVEGGKMTPTGAARELLEGFLGGRGGK